MLKHRSFFFETWKNYFYVFSKKYKCFIDVFYGILLIWKNIENTYAVLTVTITFSCVFGAFKIGKHTNTFDLQWKSLTLFALQTNFIDPLTYRFPHFFPHVFSLFHFLKFSYFALTESSQIIKHSRFSSKNRSKKWEGGSSLFWL